MSTKTLATREMGSGSRSRVVVSFAVNRVKVAFLVLLGGGYRRYMRVVRSS